MRRRTHLRRCAKKDELSTWDVFWWRDVTFWWLDVTPRSTAYAPARVASTELQLRLPAIVAKMFDVTFWCRDVTFWCLDVTFRCLDVTLRTRPHARRRRNFAIATASSNIGDARAFSHRCFLTSIDVLLRNLMTTLWTFNLLFFALFATLSRNTKHGRTQLFIFIPTPTWLTNNSSEHEY